MPGTIIPPAVIMAGFVESDFITNIKWAGRIGNDRGKYTHGTQTA
jgi:hypothetical protein